MLPTTYSNRKRGLLPSLRSKRGVLPQLSYKWKPKVPDFTQEEAKMDRIMPPPRLSAIHMHQFTDSKVRQIYKQGTKEEKQAFLNIIAQDEWNRLMQAEQDRMGEQFTKEFIDFLQGRDPTDMRNPAYIKNRLKDLNLNLYPGSLLGKGIKEWLESFTEAKRDVLNKLMALRMGPHKAFEWELPHFYLWYKYVLRDLPYKEDEVLLDFDRYWPMLSSKRDDVGFKQLGPEGWKSGLDYMGSRDDLDWQHSYESSLGDNENSSEQVKIHKVPDQKSSATIPIMPDTPDGIPNNVTTTTTSVPDDATLVPQTTNIATHSTEPPPEPMLADTAPASLPEPAKPDASSTASNSQNFIHAIDPNVSLLVDTMNKLMQQMASTSAQQGQQGQQVAVQSPEVKQDHTAEIVTKLDQLGNLLLKQGQQSSEQAQMASQQSNEQTQQLVKEQRGTTAAVRELLAKSGLPQEVSAQIQTLSQQVDAINAKLDEANNNKPETGDTMQISDEETQSKLDELRSQQTHANAMISAMQAALMSNTENVGTMAFIQNEMAKALTSLTNTSDGVKSNLGFLTTAVNEEAKQLMAQGSSIQAVGDFIFKAMNNIGMMLQGTMQQNDSIVQSWTMLQGLSNDVAQNLKDMEGKSEKMMEGISEKVKDLAKQLAKGEVQQQEFAQAVGKAHQMVSAVGNLESKLDKLLGGQSDNAKKATILHDEMGKTLRAAKDAGDLARRALEIGEMLKDKGLDKLGKDIKGRLKKLQNMMPDIFPQVALPQEEAEEEQGEESVEEGPLTEGEAAGGSAFQQWLEEMEKLRDTPMSEEDRKTLEAAQSELAKAQSSGDFGKTASLSLQIQDIQSKNKAGLLDTAAKYLIGLPAHITNKLMFGEWKKYRFATAAATKATLYGLSMAVGGATGELIQQVATAVPMTSSEVKQADEYASEVVTDAQDAVQSIGAVKTAVMGGKQQEPSKTTRKRPAENQEDSDAVSAKKRAHSSAAPRRIVKAKGKQAKQ